MTPGAGLRLGMLRETYDLALGVAGEVWPTPVMALDSIFRRGIAFLEGGGDLAPIVGSAPPELLEALNRARADLLVVETQYAFTKYVAFVLTHEGQELEATWLALADEHLLIRDEIVACRREEERLKREIAALGAPMTPLPEHEPLPETRPDRPRKSRGMYADLFEGASVVEATLDAAPDALAAADRLSEANGWSAEWGGHARLVIFAYGLALALRQREADRIDPDDADSVRRAQDDARGRLMGLDRRYATLRYHLFELRHNNRIVGWRITALRIEARGMRSRLELFGSDRRRLEEQLAELRAAAPPPTPTVPPVGWRARLGRLLGAPGREP